MLEEVSADCRRKADELTAKNPDANAKMIASLREVAINAQLQRSWTAYYKAQMYEAGQPQYNDGLAEAKRLFQAFEKENPNVLGVLFARYGLGLCNKAQGERDAALANFDDVRKLVDNVDPVPELQALKARCTINWAEVSTEKGQFDEAVAAIDAMMTENQALGKETELADLARLAKAKALAGKAAKLKADGNADEASKLYEQAVGVLKEGLEKGSAKYSYEAASLIATYVRASGLVALDAESRLALAEALLRDKKYKEAMVELKKTLDAPGPGLTPDVAFRTRRNLALALRYAEEYGESVKEFESILRLDKDRPKAELAKVAQDFASTMGEYAKANPDKPEADKQYMEAIRRLAQDYPGTKEGTDGQYYYAEALKRRAGSVDKWEEAARAYASVPEGSEFHARSRYLEGLCYYNVFRVYSKKRDEKNPKAVEALKTAHERLVEVTRDLLPSKTDGERWPVEAVATLAEIRLDLNQPKEALDGIETAMKNYPEAAGDPRILAVLVKAYVVNGRLEQAESVLDGLAQKETKPEALLRGYMTLGDAYFRKFDVLQKEGKLEEGAQFARKAAEIFGKALPCVPPADTAVFDWLAKRLFMARDYEGCLKALAPMEKQYETHGWKPDPNLWQLRLMRAQCYKALAEWPPEALELLKQLEEQYRTNADIKILRASVAETKEQWKEALTVWGELERGVAAGSAIWFEVKYHRALCHYKLGEKKTANEIVDTLMTLNPKMHDPETKKKFEELRDKYGK
jgi:tetratricopeptide (TPR) repeat protein